MFYKYNSETQIKAPISDLYFAIHLVAAVLSDADEREIPIVPDALRKDMMKIYKNSAKLGHVLFSVIGTVAIMETNILREKRA